MSAANALTRTTDLVLADIFPGVAREDIVAALTSVRVRLSADEANLSSPAGQTALIAAAIVAAQSGGQLVLDLPNVPLVRPAPPLGKGHIAEALLDLTADLIMPACQDEGQPADLTVALGSAPTRNARGRVLRIAPSDEGFELEVDRSTGGAQWMGDRPFAAMLAGMAAGAEAFRAGMRKLVTAGATPALEHAVREPRAVAIRIPEPTGSREVGRLDVISAGAITHAMVFALQHADACGYLRVFDHDRFDWQNLNRYLLGRRSWLGTEKTALLAACTSGGVQIEAIPRCFDEELQPMVELADCVAVGVDHIPSRWLAQEAAPGTVVVGATSHFEVVVSEHPPGSACAQCLYRDGEDDGRPIPTVSFVSALAGILQAYRLLSPRLKVASQLRAYPLNLAGAEPLIELGVKPKLDCPVCHSHHPASG